MNLRAALIAVIAVTVLALAAPCAFTQSAPEILKITGDPKIMKQGSDKWSACAVDMEVGNGDKIRTAKDESVEVGFAQRGQGVVKVGPDSDVVVARGQDPYLIELVNGEAWALIMNLPKDSTFEVKTPTGISGARGTGWRSATDGRKSAFEVYDNTIYVKGLNADGSAMKGETFVDMGYKTTVEKFEKPGLLEKLTDREMERWNAWRDDVRSRETKPAETGDRGVSAPSGGSTQAGRDRLDRISREETADVESLEARKQDISESRDTQRIQERESQPSPAAEENRTTGGGSIGPY